MKQRKVFEIPKELVWLSYQQVRRNKGSAGCDGQTVQKFEENLNRNLYRIWNRLKLRQLLSAPRSREENSKGGWKGTRAGDTHRG